MRIGGLTSLSTGKPGLGIGQYSGRGFMPRFTIDQAKSYFKPEKVWKVEERMESKFLGMMGGFIRKQAKALIMKSPGGPGNPPRKITGILNRFIYYAKTKDSEGNRAVIVGPALLSIQTAHPEQQFRFDEFTVPEILEYGGTGTMRRQSAGRSAFGKRVTITKRPYMRPALASAESKKAYFLKKAWQEAWNSSETGLT